MSDKRKNTSILVDPTLWEEFKKLADNEGRSATKQLNQVLRAAVAENKTVAFVPAVGVPLGKKKIVGKKKSSG